jgi:hypothetical protein
MRLLRRAVTEPSITDLGGEMSKLTQEKMIRLRAHRAPSQRDLTFKPSDAGQPVTWTRVAAGHWTIPGATWQEPGSGTYIPAKSQSAGPVANSVWARCEDGTMVVLGMPAHRNALLRKCLSPCEMTAYGDTWWRDAVRRAEHVRSFGSVFAAVDSVRTSGYGRSARADEVVTWHCDPSCPDAAGKKRSEVAGYYGYGLWDVVDKLTGRAKSSGHEPFCQHCIYLNQPAESLAAAA